MPKNFVGEPFNISENLGSRKTLCLIRRYHDFPSKIFCLTVPINFVGESFNVSENLGSRKTLCIIRRYHDFPSKIFCLTVPINFAEEHFGVSFFVSQYRKISLRNTSVFPGTVETFLSHSAEKFALQYFRKFWVSENFMHNRKVSRKISLRNTSLFQKISGIEKF